MDPRALLKDLQSHTLSLTHEVAPERTVTYAIDDSHELVIHEDDSGGVATVVWQAVLVQCRYMLRHGLGKPGGACLELAKGTVVELGAGTGFVGLFMAKYLAGGDVAESDRVLDQVYLTDIDAPKVMAVLDANVAANGVADVCTVAPLDWRAPEEWSHTSSEAADGKPVPAHIVVCECVYNGYFHEALLASLRHLAGSETLIHICFAERNPEGEAAFFVRAAELGFEVTKIADDIVDACKSSNDAIGDNEAPVYLYMLQKASTPPAAS
ncbi:uncharacterized protein AMSG_10336 [Thecamonas trahens ATCC 50062]|uniref:Nicotinamide N-methyltransferase n=1 Tax=Thecamonas trahens ATCC 50062 TaxID=461836 RepID=A0A0L0DSB0_THETB|nr:hypothetical protein AMSG_10336 [Thecamonas trahens ATCC 50062]KNC54343.1 hypothetical protein AMSG_10336 [Thecamonas trahens ATCC 50062]|eukprot:XP_013753799.1 hypothetical protein AMSG_10336 [Thecamonas trahens ATCC 50062]